MVFASLSVYIYIILTLNPMAQLIGWIQYTILTIIIIIVWLDATPPFIYLSILICYISKHAYIYLVACCSIKLIHLLSLSLSSNLFLCFVQLLTYRSLLATVFRLSIEFETKWRRIKWQEKKIRNPLTMNYGMYFCLHLMIVCCSFIEFQWTIVNNATRNNLAAIQQLI